MDQHTSHLLGKLEELRNTKTKTKAQKKEIDFRVQRWALQEATPKKRNKSLEELLNQVEVFLSHK